MQIGRAFVRTAVFLSGTSFTNGSVVGGGRIFRQSAGHNGCQIVGTANLFLLPLQFGQIRFLRFLLIIYIDFPLRAGVLYHAACTA